MSGRGEFEAFRAPSNVEALGDRDLQGLFEPSPLLAEVIDGLRTQARHQGLLTDPTQFSSRVASQLEEVGTRVEERVRLLYEGRFGEDAFLNVSRDPEFGMALDHSERGIWVRLPIVAHTAPQGPAAVSLSSDLSEVYTFSRGAVMLAEVNTQQGDGTLRLGTVVGEEAHSHYLAQLIADVEFGGLHDCSARFYQAEVEKGLSQVLLRAGIPIDEHPELIEPGTTVENGDLMFRYYTPEDDDIVSSKIEVRRSTLGTILVRTRVRDDDLTLA